MSLIKHVCITLTTLFCVVVTIVLVRTFTLTRRNIDVSDCSPFDSDFIEAGIESDKLKRFQEALRIQTIAREPGDYNRIELRQLVDYIISGDTSTCPFSNCPCLYISTCTCT